MINRVILIGRLVADPEIRYTQNGIAVANIRLAVDRTYKSASGERQTDFIRVVAWRKQAELVEKYLNKGRLVAIEGSLRQNQYQTKEGENRTTYEVEADTVQFLDRGDRSGGGRDSDAPQDNEPSSSGGSAGYDSSTPDDENDLPF